jgi:hypothetical protein
VPPDASVAPVNYGVFRDAVTNDRHRPASPASSARIPEKSAAAQRRSSATVQGEDGDRLADRGWQRRSDVEQARPFAWVSASECQQ